MTLIAVKEGVFRAYAPMENRGRRKQRGEFLPVAKAKVETPSARTVNNTDEPASELCLRYEDSGSGKTTLVVSGTLDLTTVLPFRDAVFTAIGNKPFHLVVDITRLSDADVAGISALVTAGRVARLMKVPFSVAPCPFLKTLLEDTGMTFAASVIDPLH